MKLRTKRLLMTLLMIGAIAGGSLAVYGAGSLYFQMPMGGTIPDTGSVALYMNGAFWSNGSYVGFGEFTPGQPSIKDFDVHNTGNIPLQITFSVTDFPSGWDVWYNRNGTTLQSGNWLNGTVTVTPNAQEIPGDFNWTCHVHAT